MENHIYVFQKFYDISLEIEHQKKMRVLQIVKHFKIQNKI